ncbi:MAG: hypothetical protein VX777_04315 [Chlamydiota bacterium]|nr:hypothetical protein [Chlamydiota bacterium]
MSWFLSAVHLLRRYTYNALRHLLFARFRPLASGKILVPIIAYRKAAVIAAVIVMINK